MMNNPITCRESIKLGNTYICKLECTPCALHFGKECAKEKMDRFVKNMSKIINASNEVENGS